MNTNLKVYRITDRIPWPKTYSGKFLFVTFIGIHIPLIGIILYLLPLDKPANEVLPIIFVALVTTLFGMTITLWFLSKLLNPILLSSSALEEYVNDRKLPDMPTEYRDEIGQLMKNLQQTILYFDDLLKLKNNLLSIISHDSKSPINSVMLAQELIAKEIISDQPDTDKILKYVNLSRRSARNQLEMMHSILTLARLDSGNVTIEKSEISLTKIMEIVRDTNALKTKTKNLVLDIRMNSLDNAIISVDKIKLTAVLNNLVQNAIKFSNPGNTIKIRTTLEDHYFCIQVSDHGIGIEAAQVPHLFEKDSNTHHSGTQNEKGNGIGLWICKLFTELHGGSIEVKSEVGAGTTFSLRFKAECILVNQ